MQAGPATAQLFNLSNPVENISIAPEQMNAAVTYKTNMSCLFRVATYIKGKKASESAFLMHTKRVKNRILITHKKTQGDSSILIATNGDLIDYNVPSGAGTRTAPESKRINAFWLDAPTGLHPRFVRGGAVPGDFAGEILGPDKKVFARLLYRGRSNFLNGKQAFASGASWVFDIMSTERSAYIPNGMPVGRIVIDQADGLLQALVLGSKDRVQYQRQNCAVAPVPASN